MLLQLIPPQLHAMAQQLADWFELVGAQIHYFIHHIFIPAVLFVRAFTLFAIKIYFLLKCMALGVELYGWISNKIPTSFVTQARNMVQSLSGSSTSVEFFLMNFSKCLCLLLISLIPETLPKIIQFAFGTGIVTLIVLDPYQFFIIYIQKFCTFLMTYYEFSQLMSSTAGRWSLIVGTVYFVNNDSKLRKMSVIFIFGLYFLRVYELAMTATPNFLP